MTKIKLQLFGLGKVWDEQIVEANDPDEIQGAIDSMNSSLPRDVDCAVIMSIAAPSKEDCWDGDETDKIIQ
jgi:hypothetical protein